MERLLIVDDEPGIRMLLKDYFEMMGYEIRTAENGREAVRCAGEQPDLILLDINLPDMDGVPENPGNSTLSDCLFNGKD